MFHHPSAVRILFIIICLFPGTASAALIWDFEVRGADLSGSGQFEVDAPSPGNLLAFSFSGRVFGQIFGDTFTLSTDDIVTSFWDIDVTTGTLTSASFVSSLVASNTRNAFVSLNLGTQSVIGPGFGTQNVFAECFANFVPGVPSLGCNGNNFTVSFGTAVFSPSQPNQPVPEPTSLILLASGLVALGGYRWHQRRGVEA